ncbi:NlpC/P60 family protein [Kibdelosporangium philippinense]|uniref:NlpC/P60 family protein n=1 Tax=Kibdelosporangium philippinense TaxID=211113 RepID=A0ABS8ZMP4_9PSEU|nr:C40 family peptidase [Kibdelosporangium philippinense]MCE7007077.1 NlpC/P60 family protein [Kibdelosporangium philippinense]
MRLWLTITVLSVALLGGLIVVLTSMTTSTTIALGIADGSCQPLSHTGDSAEPTGAAEQLSEEQRSNATLIIQVGRELSMPGYGQQIAVATAMQESRLRNLDHGDRDSIGLFQQRPSMGWGTREQILDSRYASTKFYARLREVPNWQQKQLWEAADAVQRSGYPHAYQQWAQLAAELVQQHGSGVNCVTPGGPHVEQAIQFATAQLGKPYEWGATGPNSYDCSGLMLRAWGAAGVALNRTSREQWRNGDPIPIGQAARGDLLFWSYDGTPAGIHHVAMYLGDGTIVEAQQTGVPVHIRPIKLAPAESELMPHSVRVRATLQSQV